jgi:hypothetical protein
MSVNNTPSGLVTKPEKFSYIEAKRADVQSVQANAVQTDTFALPTGASNGDVLTSDANGNATWQAAAGGSPSSDVTGFGFTYNAAYTTQGTGPTFTRSGNSIQAYVTGRVVAGLGVNSSVQVGQLTLPAGSSFFLPNGYNPLTMGMTVNRKQFVCQLLQPNGFVNIHVPQGGTAISVNEVSDFTIHFHITQP